MNSGCEFYNRGPCGGSVIPHSDLKWCKHPNATSSDNKPATQYDMKPVMMCGTHRNKLSVQHGDGKGGIHCIYGFDEADAFDMLINTLKHTGAAKPQQCDECGFSLKYYAFETNKECALTCESLLNNQHNWIYDCTCKERVECVCSLRSNNKLHWAITTYSNGFDNDLDLFVCISCPRPSWSDEHHEYYARLMPVDTIISMAKENPKFLEAKNASDHTPMNLIDIILHDLTMSTAKYNEYAKLHEDGWARHNIDCLTKLKKELSKMIEEYNNTHTEEWENYWKILRV